MAHEPFGHRPTTLLLRVRRFRCEPCARFWQEDTTRVAEPRSKLTRTALGWALRALVVDHLTVSRVAAGLDVAWHTANTAVLEEGRRLLIDDPERFDGVAVIGVDEHVWRHTRRGDKFVTVIIDLTPVHDGTGPSRLLDMVEGRSKSVFKAWLAGRPEVWRAGIEVVAMDGFSGFKTAAAEEIPTAVAVMDPFHVVRLAGEALDTCRRRVQNNVFGRRGRKDDPLYKARRTLHTGASLLTDRQVARLETLFADEHHVEVEATHGIYQRMITAYRQEDRKLGKFLMQCVIDTVARTASRHRWSRFASSAECSRSAPRTSSHTSIGRGRPMGRRKRSTADSSIYAALRSASGTSPTTSPAVSSKPEASDLSYTLSCDEPDILAQPYRP